HNKVCELYHHKKEVERLMTLAPTRRGGRRKVLSVIGAVGSASLLLAACGGTGGDDSASSNTDVCDLAEGYPSGPIELIVPWAAGGGTDSVGRLIGDKLSDALDTQVNVVNREGGSGVVGHKAIANA